MDHPHKTWWASGGASQGPGAPSGESLPGLEGRWRSKEPAGSSAPPHSPPSSCAGRARPGRSGGPGGRGLPPRVTWAPWWEGPPGGGGGSGRLISARRVAFSQPTAAARATGAAPTRSSRLLHQPPPPPLRLLPSPPLRERRSRPLAASFLGSRSLLSLATTSPFCAPGRPSILCANPRNPWCLKSPGKAASGRDSRKRGVPSPLPAQPAPGSQHLLAPAHSVWEDEAGNEEMVQIGTQRSAEA
ncbi:collagen alpha-2(I) chain-like [Mustela putorius furo]|uniref:Collagen alpha-2(I) chain-like n=1 Tax=Mustela putorius furo TaxID=9669 RepID=A0A8U0RI32_MUSPF|nr:collagen alpha-2(I) chain-like [Mustela putorius furo]